MPRPPPPVTLPAETAPPGDDIARALAIVLTDGARARRLARSCLEAPGRSPAERAMACAVSALAELRDGDPDVCLPLIETAEALGDRVVIGDRAADLLQHMRAQWLRREGRLAEAEALMRPLFERTDQRPLIDAYLTASAMGTVLSMRGDDEASLSVFYQALTLARRSGEESLTVNALNNLGSFQSDLYNLEDAEPLLQECLAGALRLGSHRQIIFAAGNLVQCLCMMGRGAEALDIARVHLIARIRPDDVPSLHRDEEIAHAMLDNGLVDEAAAALDGQTYVDLLSNELATVRVWLEARIRLARGAPQEALALCQARLAHLQAQGEAGTPAIDRINLMSLAAQAAHEVADHALAYRLLQQAFATHEQLLGRAARSRQLSLRIAHGLQQAEWERDAAQQMASRLEALNASLQAQVAENERLQQQLRAQALEDPLTGAYNRRHLLDAGSALLSLMKRRGEPLSAALVDLDHFKQVNDRHGHEAGDQVLRAFADLARLSTRAEDLVCRYGGEEFVLLMPGARGDQAVGRLRDLLQSFSALQFGSPAGQTFSCTFSAGVATATTEDDHLPMLLAQADKALYAAKAAGRDRVEQLRQTAAAGLSL